MRRCNVTCDSTLLSVTGCMNIQEDIHRRESTRMKFINIPSECSKMRSESSEYMWKTTNFFTNSWRMKITLESYFEKTCTGSLGEQSDES